MHVFNRIRLSARTAAAATTLGIAALTWVVVTAAPLANPSAQPLNYVASPALSSYTVGGGNSIAYSIWFENGAWTGDLIAASVNSDGVVSSTALWKAKSVFDSVSATYWNTSRIVITTDGGFGNGWSGNQPGATNKVPFRYNDGSATAGTALLPPQQASITGVAADQRKIIDFVRGDRGNESPSGSLRQRYSILGDIIHSNPVYVGAPVQAYMFDNYDAFKSANATRPKRVYVGANDGMLHAFDAANGQEVFAYVPSMVIPNLAKLAATPYVHTYFVDGELNAWDVYGNFPGCASSPCWRTVLVGGLGAGGKGFFALDVTTPVTTSDTESSARSLILWEIGAPNSAADPDLGYTFSRPSIVRLKTGQWVMIAGNGYDSADGKSVLYLVDMATGTVAKSYASTTAGTATDKNGLSSPAVVDVDGDGVADYVYAGDINGNLWRFDLTQITSNPLSGDVTSQVSSYKLYSGSPSQPIIYAPDVRKHPTHSGYMVYFGTGRAFTSSDITDPTVQAIYGLRDAGGPIDPGTISLVTQTMTQHTHAMTGRAIRTATATGVNYNLKHGWKMNLPPGERLLGNIQVRGGRVQFTVTNPSGRVYGNWLIQLDDYDGGPPLFTVFDLNQDRVLADDGTDRHDTNGNGTFTDRVDIPVAMKISDGLTPVQLTSQPVIVYLRSRLDSLLVTTQGLQPNTGCEVNCAAGFKGGHIDVDTDSPSGGGVARGSDGLGGNTDGHVHEYDKKHFQVYVDYFTLEPTTGPNGAGRKGNLNRVTDVYAKGTTTAPFNRNKKFLVLVANADLSTGGKLTIGATTTEVKKYQDALISKIKEGFVADTDLHTLAELVTITLNGNNPTATGETIPGALRMSFTDTSIIDGGLMPTNTGCVRDGSGAKFYNNRWRNGALTIQLLEVSASDLVGDQSGLKSKVYIQPDDPTTKAVEPTGVVAAYVISGGKVQASATSANSYLYESTLFWHWDKKQDIGGQIKEALGTGSQVTSTPCYGEGAYQQSLQQFRDNQSLTSAELQQLDQLISQLESSASKKDQKKAQDLKKLRGQLPSTGGSGPVQITRPADVKSQTQNWSDTPGVKIHTGQRAWSERGKH